MEITKEYLDNMVIDETNKSGEMFTLFIDFENTNIDIVPMVNSEEISPEKQLKYKEAVEYYLTLISNSSGFFEDVENETNKEIVNFKSIMFHFTEDKVEINVETSDEKTKEVLEDFFTRYEEEFGYDDFVEVYNIDVIQG